MNNKGLIGFDLVKMIPRLIMVCVVAIGVFSLFAISYEYYVDVRDAEAVILARDVSLCLSGNGVLNLDNINKAERSEILSYCGLKENERFYVGVNVSGSSGDIIKLESGDSGAIWVRDLFEKAESSGMLGNVVKNVDEIIRYNPGYFILRHKVYIINDGVRLPGKIEVEVLVKNEE